MNKFLYSAFILLFTSQIFAQGFDPKILVLYGGSTKSDKALGKEIAAQEKQIRNYFSKENYNPDEHKDRTENIQLIYKSEHEYMKDPDFFKMTGYIIEQHLLSVFYQRFKNVLVLLKHIPNEEGKTDLRRIADEEQMQFIVNIKSIELYKESKKSFARINLQLYNQDGDQILLDKSYTGNWENPGFEFACNEGSINCCINNAIAKGSDDIIKLIAANNSTLKREKQLALDRSAILLAMYPQIDSGKDLLTAIIPGF